MKGMALSALSLLAFLGLRHFFYEGHESYFHFAQFTVIGISLLTLGHFWIKNRNRKSKRDLFLELIEKRLGRTYTRYLQYEWSLLVGFLRFFKAPIRNYRATMTSYFATEKLKAIVMVFPLLLLLETGLIHLLIAEMATGSTATVLHAVVILSEYYLCQILFGHLYFLQHSAVTVDDHVHFKMGLMWELKVPLRDIERVEPSNRGSNDRTPKLALLHDDTLRIHFKRKLIATKHFVEISLDQADIFLQPEDRERLKDSLACSV